MRIGRTTVLLLGGICLCWCALFESAARGDDRYFVGVNSGGIGNWNDPNNWTGGSLPTPTDAAWILDFDERDREIYADVPVSVGTLLIGNSGGGLTTLIQTGDLTAAREVVGLGLIVFPTPHYVPKSRAVHVQDGGTTNLGELWLAEYNSNQTPSSGRYVLDGGTLNVSYLYLADAGYGTFEHNGGIHNVGAMYLSYDLNARSTYALSDGTLNAGLTVVGWGGAGTFLHAGGTQIAQLLSLGQTLGSSGSPGGAYYLSGADAVLTVDTERIARGAPGTFCQTAGTHEVNTWAVVGHTGPGRYQMDGGIFRVAGTLEVANLGRGTFDHAGGEVTIGNESAHGILSIGTNNWGVYNLSTDAASLTVWGTEYVGYNGRASFHHTVGSHFVSDTLDLGGQVIYGGSTVYHLDGGKLIVGESVLVGVFGTGAFMQTGGALSTPLLQIGPGGSFNWGGGSLSVSTVSLAGRMNVGPGSGRTLVATNVDIDNTTGQLDLADNRMVIDYASDSAEIPLAELRADLRDGALFTSVGGQTHRLAYADNRVLKLPAFGAHTFPPGDFTQLLVAYTYTGDANLDGVVDMMDLAALATHWQSAAYWTGGDFDYNGTVNVNDLGLLASNWQAGVGSPFGPSLDDAISSFGLLDVSIPEPATAGLALAVALKCHRRCGHFST